MAKVASAVSGNTITHTITDAAGVTATVAFAAPGAPYTYSTPAVSVSASFGRDGLILLEQLLQMVVSGLRPQAMAGTVASFSS